MARAQTKSTTRKLKFYFSFTPDVLADVASLPDGRRLIKLHSYRGVIDPDAWQIVDDDDRISDAVKIDAVETVEVGKFWGYGDSEIKILTVMVDNLVVGVMDDRVTVLGESVEDVVKGIAKKLEDRSVIDAFVEALEEMKKNVTEG